MKEGKEKGRKRNEIKKTISLSVIDLIRSISLANV